MKKANGKVRLCADFSSRLNNSLDTHEDQTQKLTLQTLTNKRKFMRNTHKSLFQQTMDAMRTVLTGVAAYIYGIIAIGTTQEELLQRLFCVLDRIQQYGFRLRARKCAFF